MKEYIQDTSRKTRVEDVTIYGARVKNVSKQGEGWNVTWSTLKEEGTGVVEKEIESVSLSTFLLCLKGTDSSDIRRRRRCLGPLSYASDPRDTGSRRGKGAMARPD
jgi:hypothetical protein